VSKSNCYCVEPEIVDLIRTCARLMPDKAIAGMLEGEQAA
jgi:hypothetical protein